MLRSLGGLEAGAADLAAQLADMGRHDPSEAVLRAGLRHSPDSESLKWRLGHARLRAGDFAEGWALMRSREVNITSKMTGRPQPPFPEWRGEPASSLLVFGEQGLGDQIQFARYLPVLKQRGIDVSFAGAPELIELFAPLGVRLYPAGKDQPTPRADAWVLMFDLPALLGTTLETIPPAPYLSAPPGGAGIGVLTRGGARHANDANRSMPDAFKQELLDLPGAVSLAYEGRGSFYDFAQRVAGLERVITVDTSLVHLAGAMGKPTTLLLPFMPDWRWLLEREDTPWYPSVRIVRQPAPGDWRSVVDRVKAAS